MSRLALVIILLLSPVDIFGQSNLAEVQFAELKIVGEISSLKIQVEAGKYDSIQGKENVAQTFRFAVGDSSRYDITRRSVSGNTFTVSRAYRESEFTLDSSVLIIEMDADHKQITALSYRKVYWSSFTTGYRTDTTLFQLAGLKLLAYPGNEYVCVAPITNPASYRSTLFYCNEGDTTKITQDSLNGSASLRLKLAFELDPTLLKQTADVSVRGNFRAQRYWRQIAGKPESDTGITWIERGSEYNVSMGDSTSEPFHHARLTYDSLIIRSSAGAKPPRGPAVRILTVTFDTSRHRVIELKGEISHVRGPLVYIIEFGAKDVAYDFATDSSINIQLWGKDLSAHEAYFTIIDDDRSQFYPTSEHRGLQPDSAAFLSIKLHNGDTFAGVTGPSLSEAVHATAGREVRIKTQHDKGNLTVVNAVGSTVLRATYPPHTLDLSHLPSGLYFISIEGGKPRKHLVP